jgi:hypothetical protein
MKREKGCISPSSPQHPGEGTSHGSPGPGKERGAKQERGDGENRVCAKDEKRLSSLQTQVFSCCFLRSGHDLPVTAMLHPAFLPVIA